MDVVNTDMTLGLAAKHTVDLVTQIDVCPVTNIDSEDCAADLSIDLQISYALLNDENFEVPGDAFSTDVENINVSSDWQNVVSEAAMVSPLEVVEVVSFPHDKAHTSTEERPSKVVDPVTLLR